MICHLVQIPDLKLKSSAVVAAGQPQLRPSLLRNEGPGILVSVDGFHQIPVAQRYPSRFFADRNLIAFRVGYRQRHGEIVKLFQRRGGQRHLAVFIRDIERDSLPDCDIGIAQTEPRGINPRFFRLNTADRPTVFPYKPAFTVHVASEQAVFRIPIAVTRRFYLRAERIGLSHL